MRVILKLGGRVAEEAAAQAHALRLGDAEVVVVHGGGDRITAELRRHGIAVEFVRGRRVTTPEALVIAREALLAVGAGVCAVLGPNAIHLVGDEIGLEARRLPELGLVGEPVPSRPAAVEAALADGLIPVVTPIAAGPLNVNADEAAAALAVGLDADRIVFVSDIPGVLLDGVVADRIQAREATRLLDDGVLEGGIVPKLLAAVRAATLGVHAEIGATEVLA